MEFNALIPELYVSSFEASLSFYTKALGFKLEYQRSNPNFAFLSYQGSQIMIQQDDNNQTLHNGKPEYPFGRGMNLQIDSDNVDIIVESMERHHFPLKRGVEESWYREGDLLHGCREILLMDPDGYLLRFSQSIGTKVVENTSS